jgi:hypothetical protein
MHMTTGTNTMQWFPLRVEKDKETYVFRNLLKKGYKVYMPMKMDNILDKNGFSRKVRPVFLQNLFVNAPLENIQLIEKSIAFVHFFLKDNNPQAIPGHCIDFIKMAFKNDPDCIVLNKELKGNIQWTTDNEAFGKLIFSKVAYTDQDYISWVVPVVKKTLLMDPEGGFYKYLSLEEQYAFLK